jgi:hypothetical protein
VHECVSTVGSTGIGILTKLSQPAKCNYNAFVACKEASGFGWDELTCEVTAANDVWKKYLGVSCFIWSVFIHMLT